MPDERNQPSRIASCFSKRARPIGWGLTLLTVLACVGLLRLDLSDNPHDLYARNDDASRLLADVNATFGASDRDMVLLVEGEDVLTSAALSRLQLLVKRLRANEQIDAVYSLLDAREPLRFFGRTVYRPIVSLSSAPSGEGPPAIDYTRVRRSLQEHPLVDGRIVSADARSTIIVARLAASLAGPDELSRVVNQLRLEIDGVFGGAGLQVSITGTPLLCLDTFHTLKRHLLECCSLCVATLLLIALLIFRRPQPVLLLFSGPLVGVVSTLGVMGWSGQRLDGVNILLPTLVFVIAFANAWHLVAAMRRLTSDDRAALGVAGKALREVGLACSLTSLTTAIGFGSLSLSSLTSVHRFGLYAAFGVAAGCVAVLTVVPLLSLIPWFHRHVAVGPAPRRPHGLGFVPIGKFVVRNATPLSVFAILTFAALAWIGRGVPFDMRWSEALPSHSETVASMRRLDNSFGGSMPVHVLVRWPEGQRPDSDATLALLNRVHHAIETDDPLPGEIPIQVGKPTSVLTLLKPIETSGVSTATHLRKLRAAAPEHLGRLVDRSSRRLLVTFHAPDIGARALLPRFGRLEQALSSVEAKYPGYQLDLTGPGVVSAKNLSVVSRELVASVMLAAVMVFAVLTFAFRSIRIGLVSVLPNVLPLLAIVATLAVTNTPMQVSAALALCLAIGVATDDTVHFITRFQQSYLGEANAARACLVSYRTVGRTLLLTTVVLACGFATMIGSPSPAIYLFSTLTCVSLIVALIGDLLFLPALLVVLNPPAMKRSYFRYAADVRSARPHLAGTV